MEIRRFYSPGIFKADISDRLVQVAAKMDRHQVGALAVFDAGQIVGMISERDLTRSMAQGVNPNEATVGEFMSLRAVTVDENETAMEAARRMLHGGFRHLPVTSEGRVVGTISMRDVMTVEVWGAAAVS